MKTIAVPQHSAEVNALLEQARREDLLVRAADGTVFMLTAIDDFDDEVVAARRNEKLMALLDERAKQTQTVPLDEVKRQLGLNRG